MSIFESGQSAFPDDLSPSADELRRLEDVVMTHEPDYDPFADIPEGVDLTKFVQLAAPPSYDERNAPASTLRTPDGRVAWISVFRNPDTNEVVNRSVLLLTPGEDGQESYSMRSDKAGAMVVIDGDGRELSGIETDDLSRLIEASEPINPFEF